MTILSHAGTRLGLPPTKNHGILHSDFGRYEKEHICKRWSASVSLNLSTFEYPNSLEKIVKHFLNLAEKRCALAASQTTFKLEASQDLDEVYEY